MRAELVNPRFAIVPLDTVSTNSLAVVVQTEPGLSWAIGHVLFVGSAEVWSLSDRTYIPKYDKILGEIKVRVLNPGEEVRLVV